MIRPLFITVAVVLGLQGGPPSGDRRTPQEYLDAVRAVGEPEFDPARKNEPGYKERYRGQQHALYQKKAALLLELCHAYPDDARVAEWMNRRWVLLGWNQDPRAVAQEVLADIQSTAVGPLPTTLRRDAAYWTAYYRAHQHAGDAAGIRAAVLAFVDAFPRDERGAELLAMVAEEPSADIDLRRTTYQRLARDYADTHFGKYAPGTLRRIDGHGVPIVLSFRDELSGREVSLEALRGKIIVLDFWATTCAPCIAELPRMRDIYRRYAGRGVEFIGVSLDESEEQGGRQALHHFLKRNEVPWPQYYQGQGYESAFSMAWGVGSAPTLFLLDRDGRLCGTPSAAQLEDAIIALLRPAER
jgi:thiol-disulfide isomerase/thioredoxin